MVERTPVGGTLFGRPIVKSVRFPASREVEFTNDEGRTARFTEEQLEQMQPYIQHNL